MTVDFRRLGKKARGWRPLEGISLIAAVGDSSRAVAAPTPGNGNPEEPSTKLMARQSHTGKSVRSIDRKTMMP